jgi:hypothetical protein
VNVLVLQVFVSLMLVVGAVVLFAYSVKQADHEHADRLSLFPLEEDGEPGARDAPPAPEETRDTENL